MGEQQKKRSFEHIIRTSWCKGCGVCVAFCPKQVLGLKDGKVVAERPADCIGCRLCEFRCPDYAIEIAEKDLAQPQKKNADADYDSVPPEALHV